MALDKQSLEEACCWFAADRVKDPHVTAFKQQARYHQAMWREQHGLPRGFHFRPHDVDGNREQIPNGSRLHPDVADEGHNFLSDAVREAVTARLTNPQPGQTLNSHRLKTDLLSSMPMCFNLFGELHQHPERAANAAQFLLPGVTPGPAEVAFEWSPGRGSPDYTNDRTAFDVALIIGSEGPKQVIGVETKYHEHALPEAKLKPERAARRTRQLNHYTELSERSQAFKPGWETVIGTNLEQLWRDHLLMLSMLNHPDRWSAGRYVLIYPERNLSFAAAADRYSQHLVDDDDTFAAITLEQLLDAGVLHSDSTATQFRERYLW